MFRRKLQALDYPVQGFNIEDTAMFRALISWLEDEKIRHYAEGERAGLRNITSEDWPHHLQKYLMDLCISSSSHLLIVDDVKNSPQVILDSLLSTAVALEYGDEGNPDKYAQAAANVVEGSAVGPEISAANPFDKFDFTSPEFIKGVSDLADLLKVSKGPAEPLFTLQACARVLAARYSKEAMAEGENVLKKGNAFPVQEVSDACFPGSKDPVLQHAAKILRLLFITDLRDLQTKINECIVSVQTITANPKTDTRLGKVGY